MAALHYLVYLAIWMHEKIVVLVPIPTQTFEFLKFRFQVPSSGFFPVPCSHANAMSNCVCSEFPRPIVIHSLVFYEFLIPTTIGHFGGRESNA